MILKLLFLTTQLQSVICIATAVQIQRELRCTATAGTSGPAARYTFTCWVQFSLFSMVCEGCHILAPCPYLSIALASKQPLLLTRQVRTRCVLNAFRLFLAGIE